MNLLKKINITRSYKFGVFYTLSFLLIAGIGNYYTWSKGPVESLNLLFILGWVFLYIPFFTYHKFDNWKIKEFGFIVNYKVLGCIVLFLAILFLNNEIPIASNWKSTIMEVVARTGEELFFRGFLYVLFLKIFNKQKRSWIWAIILSSICFTMVHTQTFLPEYQNSMIDVFKIGVFLALLRKWSKSILPGMLIHIFIKSFNILGLILGTALYIVFILIAYFRKKEKVFEFK